MKKNHKTFIILLMLLLVFLSHTAGFSGFFQRPLQREAANPENVQGLFTLLLHGKRFSDDLRTFAILDFEGDGYHFELYTPDFDYRIERNVDAKKAIEKTRDFVSFHRGFSHTRLVRILNEDGELVGYELKPVYHPFIYGRGDVLKISYWQKSDGKIKVNVRLDASVEKMHFGGKSVRDSGIH